MTSQSVSTLNIDQCFAQHKGSSVRHCKFRVASIDTSATILGEKFAWMNRAFDQSKVTVTIVAMVNAIQGLVGDDQTF